MKVNSLLARQLADEGVRTVFGLVGNANLSFVARLLGETDIRFVSATHEGSAVLMADGFARRTGQVSVATVTQGPGVANTISALIEATKNGTGLVVVSGASSTTDRSGHGVSRMQGTSAGGVRQGLDHRDLVLSTGAGYDCVASPGTAGRDITLALRRAELECRPIVLDVPLDVGEAEISTAESVSRPIRIPHSERQFVVPDPAVLDRAVGMVATVRRPVVLAGRGASHARDSLLQLARRLGAPLATTLQAKDFFRGEPFDLGIFGTLSSTVASEIIGEADSVLAFGAGLNPYTTDSGGLLQGKRIIHCDLDPMRIGRYSEVDIGIVGDAAQVSDAIVEWLDEGAVATPGWNSPEMERRLENDVAVQAPRTDPGVETIELSTFLRWIDGVLPKDKAVVVDCGRFMTQAFKDLRVASPRDFVFNSSGSIGLGTPLAIGVSIATPANLTVAVIGDGGFMLGGIADFNTAVRQRAPIVVIVCNDSAYGAEVKNLQNTGDDAAVQRGVEPGVLDEIVRFSWPDLAVLANSLGGTGVTVRSSDDFAQVEDLLNRQSGPLLIDVKTTPVESNAR